MSVRTTVVFGPPGCGKTTDLLVRIGDIRNSGVDKDKIGLFTFTRAAAGEALSRLGITKSKTIRTIHSLCYELSGVNRDQVISDVKMEEFSELVGYPLTGNNRMDEGERTLGDELMEFHNLTRATMKSVQDLWYDTRPDLDPSVCEVFSDSYTKWKSAYGYVDFNDMLEMVSSQPGPLDLGVRHLFVDEGQDLSPLQWSVINRILPTVDTFTVAGDDDQAIYTWAGADPHTMASLGGHQEVLSTSHRVPRRAHALAQDIVGRVEHRVAKEYAPRSEEGRLDYASSLDYVDPVYEDAMVLYRNHSTRPEVELWLMNNKVRYTVVGSALKSAFQDRYANAVRAFMTLAKGGEISNSQLSLLQKVCRPEWKDDVSNKKFSSLLRMDWADCLQIPPSRMEYIAGVDLFKPPTTRMSTIHSAKGMESDNIILMNEMGLRTSELMGDDEHRVWYVAVTRTRHNLTIVQGNNPYDIPQE